MKYCRYLLIVLLAVFSVVNVAAQDTIACDTASVAAVLEGISEQLTLAEQRLGSGSEALKEIEEAHLSLNDLRTSCFGAAPMSGADNAIAEIGEDEWTEYTADGLRINVPSSWLDVSDPAFVDASLSMFGNMSPESQTFIESNRQQLAAGALDLFLLEPLTGTSLVVVGEDAGMSFEPGFMETFMVAQFESLGFEVLEKEIVTLNAGEALYMKLLFAPEGIPGLEMIQRVYLMSEGTQLYSINMGAVTASFDSMTPIFDEIINSLVIGN